MSFLSSDHESQSEAELPQRALSLTDLALHKLQSKLKLFNDSDTISLADSFIGDSGCLVLGKFIKEHPGVTTLDLRGNNISAEGLKAIAGLLRPPTSLVSLSLEWNNAHLGLEALGEALGSNTTLRSLDLRNNKIGAEGATILAKSLSTNRTLQKLDLRWNDMGLEGVKRFLDLLETQQTAIQQLELSGNKAPEEVIKQVEALLKGGVTTPRRAYESPDQATLTMSRRKSDQFGVHGRNRSSGTYRRRELEVRTESGNPLSHTRLESQIADLEFALEQEQKRNADLVSALAAEQQVKKEVEGRNLTLQEALDQALGNFEEEKKDLEYSLEEAKRQREEAVEELTRLQELYSRQQGFAQGQVKDVEARLQELQKALNIAESDLSDALANKKQDQDAEYEQFQRDFDNQINLKDAEIANLVEFKEKIMNENRALRGELVQTQEARKQSMTSFEVQFREEETRRFDSTFHSLDQKLKSVQELRDSMVTKSQEMQRDLMRAEKKAMEQTLSFELERGKLQDQVRELNAQMRELQAEVSELKGTNAALTSTLQKIEAENDELKRELSEQAASFHRTLGQMLTEQRADREQWEQQRTSTFNRIQALEGQLTLGSAEKRRALDEYASLASDLKQEVARALQDTVKLHVASLDPDDK